MANRREGRQHRVAALIVQAAGRQHSPLRLRAALPSHLELLDEVAICQPLEEARTHPSLESRGPGVLLLVSDPGHGLLVRVQHLVLRDRRYHDRDRHRCDQLLLGAGGPCRRDEFLLRRSLQIQAFEHPVKGEHELADLIGAVAFCAQAVVSADPYELGDIAQAPQWPRDLPCHIDHGTQQGHQEEQCCGQVPPHALELQVDPRLE